MARLFTRRASKYQAKLSTSKSVGLAKRRGDRKSLWLEGDTKGVMSGLGFHPTVVERPRNKLEAIAAARTAFARCQFDEGACELGLRRLRAYRKEWDESREVWKDRPRHDDASHGADAFLTFACNN